MSITMLSIRTLPPAGPTTYPTATATKWLAVQPPAAIFLRLIDARQLHLLQMPRRRPRYPQQRHRGIPSPVLARFRNSTGFCLCDFDMRKVVHLAVPTICPWGRGRQFEPRRCWKRGSGGWSTNWVLTLQDGKPFNSDAQLGTTTSLGCYALTLPGQSVIGGPHNVNQWMNPAAFVNPAQLLRSDKPALLRWVALPLKSWGRDSIGSTFPFSSRFRLPNLKLSNFGRKSLT